MTLRTIGVLDYGSGNLHSVCRALAAAGAEVRLERDITRLTDLDGLVVPGVGAFDACMQQLSAVGGDELVRTHVAAGRPLLAICVGHQVLFSSGIEHGVETAGVGIFPGQITRVDADRLPHMGWNTLEFSGAPGVFSGLTEQRFYFVHSYAAHAVDEAGLPSLPADAEVAWVTHEHDRFVAAVQWQGVVSTQFHPEKSGAPGAHLLSNWLMG